MYFHNDQGVLFVIFLPNRVSILKIFCNFLPNRVSVLEISLQNKAEEADRSKQGNLSFGHTVACLSTNSLMIVA